VIYRILALDGGGTAGYLQARLLGRLERATASRVCALFDLVHGVSAGALVGAALSVGVRADDVADRMAAAARDIFRRRDWRPWKAWYDIGTMRRHVDLALGPDRVFGDCLVDFTCMATKFGATGLQPRFWKADEDRGESLNTAVVASGAAPVFFDPVELPDGWYVDGALGTNNMTMCAIADALRAGYPLRGLQVVNLQTGPAMAMTKRHGLWGWLRDGALINTAVKATDAIVEYQAHSLIGFRNHVIRPERHLGLDSLDFARMDDFVDTLWRQHEPALRRTFQF